jgi:hypothetical protein
VECVTWWKEAELAWIILIDNCHPVTSNENPKPLLSFIIPSLLLRAFPVFVYIQVIFTRINNRIGKSHEAEMIIDPIEAEVVKMIFRWYTSREDGGPLSLMAIANRLDQMGIKPRTSRIWQPNSVRAILVNETYVGRMYYRKTKILKDGRQVPRPKSEWTLIDVSYLAIIDQRTFDIAQARAKRNLERASRNRKHEYLLVGHIRCGSCGLAMYGFRKWEGSKPYYRCASYNNKLAQCGFHKRSIQMERADKAVWEWLSSLLEDETVLMEGLRNMAERREQELEPRREQYAAILKMIDTSDEKIRRLVEELSEFTGSTVKAVIKEKISQMETEQNFLQEEKVRLEAELAELEISPETEVV